MRVQEAVDRMTRQQQYWLCLAAGVNPPKKLRCLQNTGLYHLTLHGYRLSPAMVVEGRKVYENLGRLYLENLGLRLRHLQVKGTG